MINVLQLQSRFELLQHNFKKAKKLLDQAHLTATEKQLEKLESDVETDLTNLENEFEQIKNLVDSNQTMATKIDQLRIQNYIDNARKYTDHTDRG